MKFFNSKGVKKGFTLIELLVVVAIIGILASIIAVSLSSARAKGRDAKRISDLRTIQLALEEYYNDNGAYPSASSVLVSSGYLPNLPSDPKDNTTPYIYYAVGTSASCIKIVGYHLGVLLEDSTNSALKSDVDAIPAVYAGDSVCSGGTTGYSAGFDGRTGPNAGNTSCAAGALVGLPTEQCYDVTN
jgi:prepilin-type N-terminal cleavage/methylation domain-containing protein